MVLRKLIDRGGEELNKEMECLFTEVSQIVTAGREQASVHTHTWCPVSQLPIFLKMEHVIAVQDTTELTSRVLQQSLITDLKTK